MNFAGVIACAVVVVVLGEVTGTPNKQLLVKGQSKIKDASSIFLGEELEEDLEDLELATKSLVEKKTKLSCKIAGGECKHKKKDCHGGYGWCFEGKEYCKYSKFYCCCVPPPKKGCVFGDISYPHKAILTDSCFWMQCFNGEWNLTYNEIKPHCCHCKTFPDSCIQAFNGTEYKYNQTGTFTFTGEFSGTLDYFFVDVTFADCGGSSCVESVYYFEHELSVFISPENPFAPSADLVKVDGYPAPMESGTSRTFHSLGGSVWLFKESPFNFYLTSSKGLSLRISREILSINPPEMITTLEVWAGEPHPNEGLCTTIIPITGRSLLNNNAIFKKRARLGRK